MHWILRDVVGFIYKLYSYIIDTIVTIPVKSRGLGLSRPFEGLDRSNHIYNSSRARLYKGSSTMPKTRAPTPFA